MEHYYKKQLEKANNLICKLEVLASDEIERRGQNNLVNNYWNNYGKFEDKLNVR